MFMKKVEGFRNFQFQSVIFIAIDIAQSASGASAVD
jgi:hypothetical protein